MNCELCNQRPANLYLTHKGLNKYACWPCAQWAITAATDEEKFSRYVQRISARTPEKTSRIKQLAKEIAAWALAL